MHAKAINLLGAIVLVIASQIPFECHAALNSFEMKKLECTFDEIYFNQNESECAMKMEDGRNKFAGGHSELIKPIDDDAIVVTIELLYMGNGLENINDHLLFNFSQNVCHLADDMKHSLLASIVRPLWVAHTNIPFKCPVQAANYSVKGIDYDSIGQMIPVSVRSGLYKIVIKAHHKTNLMLTITTEIMVKSLWTQATAKTTASAVAAKLLLLKKASTKLIE